MRPCLVAVVMLASLGCHRRRVAPRVRDPRAEFATGCVDPRYVSAPSGVVATSTEGPVTAVATAALGRLRAVAFSTAAGVTLAREGSAPVRVTGPIAPDGFAFAGTSERLLLTSIDARTSSLQLAAIGADGRAEAWPPLSRSASAVALAACRDGAFVAWIDGAGERVVLRGAPLDARGRTTHEAVLLARGPVSSPAVTFTGARWVVAWREGASFINGRVVSRGGEAGPSMALVETAADAPVGAPSIAWGGDRLAVAWSDQRNGDRALQFATRTLGGAAPRESQRMSVRFDREARASIAWDGAAFGVTWWEPVSGGLPRVYMALVDRGGRRLGTPMRFIVDDEAALTLPAMGWERPDYFVAAVRSATVVEARRTGPRGCDMPPAQTP